MTHCHSTIIKNTRQRSAKNVRFTACTRVHSFWLAMNTGLPRDFLRHSPSSPIDLLASSRRGRERTAAVVLAGCNMLTCATVSRNFRISNLRDPANASPPRDAHWRSENRFWGGLPSPRSSQSAGWLFLHVPRPYPQRRLQATILVRMGLVRG